MPMVTIKDENFGTPMRVFDNGSAIVEDKPDRHTEFVTVNRLIEGSRTAKDENVETYRNFIFEIDNEDINTQKERARLLFEKRIINRAVYSGNKSVHCRITLADEPENKEEYKYAWSKLNEAYFEGKADKSCSNPARLTRMPTAIRSNGVKQQRLHLSNEVLYFDWRAEYELGKKLDCYLPKTQTNNYNFGNGKTPVEILLKRNIPIEARKLLENNFMDGEKHKMMPRAIKFLKKCGYGLCELETLVKTTNIRDGVNYVKNMYQYSN